MLKTALMAVTALTLVAGNAEAVSTVKNTSKYPVRVLVFGWDTGKACKSKAAEDSLPKEFISGFKSVIGGLRVDGNIDDRIESAIKAVSTKNGCDNVGYMSTLKEKETLSVPAGAVVVAFKSIILAQKDHEKSVNPFPTAFKVEDRKVYSLKTNKGKDSSFCMKLLSTITFCDDFGLTYED